MRKALSIVAFVLALSSGVGLLYLGSVAQTPSVPKQPANSDVARATVSIVSQKMRAGGTGVILKSAASGSLILTNKHVCQLVQVGGLVITDNASYNVAEYKVYPKHDLCLIRVLENLGINTSVSKQVPKLYSTVIVSGHPALLPTIVSRGHFSSRMSIQLMVDTEKCTGDETDDQEQAFCAFFGVKPVLQTHDAQVISALIMPGSSGSAAYNEQGEISGLVFAGPGEGIGYGMIVPLQYVQDFLANENKYAFETPDPNAKPRNFFTQLQKVANACKVGAISTWFCNKIKFQEIKSF